MKGNCTTLQRFNGTGWDTISKRVSITGPSRSRETVEQELTLDCDASGGSSTKKKSPGTKEIGDISVEVLWNPTVPTGTHAVETATVAGTVTVAGNASVTITSAGMPGSPLVLAIPVTTGSGGAAAAVASTIREFLGTHASAAAVRDKFEILGELTAVILKEKVPAVEDATRNIAIATGTATGITAAPTSTTTVPGVAGEENDENHHLFEEDFDNETATFWRIVHENAASTGTLVHATVKELGDPSYEPNKDVKVTFTLEPTGEFFEKANDIENAVLPSTITAPQDHWGHN